MLEIGKTYRVKTLEDFKKMNTIIKFYDCDCANTRYSVDNMSKNVAIHHMNSTMTAFKKVTIEESKELGFYHIKEDKYSWEEWMLVVPITNTIMNTE